MNQDELNQAINQFLATRKNELQNLAKAEVEVQTETKKADDDKLISDVRVFAIKDEDMGITDIITYPNRMIAMRTFADLANNEKSAISKHPDKFQLWELGVFNSDTGEYSGTPKMLEKASNLKEQTN